MNIFEDMRLIGLLERLVRVMEKNEERLSKSYPPHLMRKKVKQKRSKHKGKKRG